MSKRFRCKDCHHFDEMSKCNVYEKLGKKKHV